MEKLGAWGYVLLALWCLGLGIGIRAAARYETSEGASGASPKRWPADSRLPRRDGFSVVMFLHPECPCSRASLGELAAIVASTHVSVLIVFVGEGDGMWDQAGRIRGAVRVRDDGSEAARFGTVTSGHVVVYDAAGALRFTGGITGSRGHAGKNVGRQTVQQLLAGASAPAQHAVFGCAMEAL